MSADADVGSADPNERTDSLTAHDLAFRARALAQAHALSESALQYRAWRVGRDSPQHPFPELATWAATAFLTGYCVRCVEESFVAPESSREKAKSATAPEVFAAWDTAASEFVNRIATTPESTLVEHQIALAALDDVISREINKRTEHVKEQVPSGQWSQFEDFIGWWTLHGYAIRAIEP